MHKGFSAGVFTGTFLLIGLFVSLYGRMAGMPWENMWKYWVSEGNFPQVVAITGITGYVTYKFFDLKGRLTESKSAAWAMILWFLFFLLIKFVFR